jgi:hypothetical protein
MAFSSGSFSEVPFSTISGYFYSSDISESATGSDSVSALTTFVVSVLEAATGADIISGNYLWIPVDNQQTATWITVNNTESGAWTPVDNTSNPTWLDIQM